MSAGISTFPFTFYNAGASPDEEEEDSESSLSSSPSFFPMIF